MGSHAENVWTAPLTKLASDVMSMAPKLLAAVVLLVVGLALAWAVRSLVSRVLKLLKVDSKLGDLWLFRVWSRGLKGRTPSAATANFSFYVMLFATVLLAIHTLGVEAGQSVLAALLGVVPRVLSFMQASSGPICGAN